MATAESIAADFKRWLESKGWARLGPDSLAKRLKVDSSVVRSALTGKPVQRRSSYRLWKATGLGCFQVEVTPLEKWFYENNHYPRTLADLIKKQTGQTVSVNTLESISQSNGVPSRENAALIYQVTGLEFFNLDGDPVEATRQQLLGGQSQEAKSSVNQTSESGSSILEQEVSKLRSDVAVLRRQIEIMSKIMNIDWAEQVSPIDQFALVFESLVDSLSYFKTATPAERKALVDRVGVEHFSHWVGMLSALTDEKQFEFWKQMSSEPAR